MATSVSLEQFVSAFSDYASEVRPDSWVWQDLKLDDDELGWVLMEISVAKNWSTNSSHNFDGYLYKSGGYWLFRPPFADLKLRELYAFMDGLEPNDG